mgnify:CR=1 FL=1
MGSRYCRNPTPVRKYGLYCSYTVVLVATTKYEVQEYAGCSDFAPGLLFIYSYPSFPELRRRREPRPEDEGAAREGGEGAAAVVVRPHDVAHVAHWQRVRPRHHRRRRLRLRRRGAPGGAQALCVGGLCVISQ